MTTWSQVAIIPSEYTSQESPIICEAIGAVMSPATATLKAAIRMLLLSFEIMGEVPMALPAQELIRRGR